MVRWGSVPGHDRGRVLTDVAVMLADCGEAISDIDVLRQQTGVVGPVASPPINHERSGIAPNLDERPRPEDLGVESVPMARVDYVDDDAAPAINSVVPSVVAVVRDAQSRILMIHKTDNDKWALPGGGHEFGESIQETVFREVLEETGYHVKVEKVTGLYTNPRHVMAYDDGEVRQQFSIAFLATLTGGDARTSSESDEVEWLTLEQIEDKPIHPSMHQRIIDALNYSGSPALR